ncbi:MAG: hypothetical protein ACOYKE_02105 [Ferruginibacter sp.]
MFKSITQHWNFMRALRLAMGIFIVVQGIEVKDTLFAIAGGVFALMALFNMGCCATGNCSVPANKIKSTEKVPQTIYEEVV